MNCYRCLKEIQNESYLHLEDPVELKHRYDLCIDCAVNELNTAIARKVAIPAVTGIFYALLEGWR